MTLPPIKAASLSATSPASGEGASFAARRTGPQPGDRWIPWLFVLFFAVVFAVNFIFISIAIQTHTGVVREDAYQTGVSFNAVLKEAQQQHSMGITQKATFEDGILRWQLLGPGDQPLSEVAATVTFYQPAGEHENLTMTLSPRGAGVYEARANLPAAGQWIAQMEATWQSPPEEMKYAQMQRYKSALRLIAP
jgi:nitrogen fixation protein FixH